MYDTSVFVLADLAWLYTGASNRSDENIDVPSFPLHYLSDFDVTLKL
jgi:hypothetical protein